MLLHTTQKTIKTTYPMVVIVETEEPLLPEGEAPGLEEVPGDLTDMARSSRTVRKFMTALIFAMRT